MNEKKFEKEILVCYLNVSNLKCLGEKKFLDRGGRGSGNFEKMVTVGYEGEGGSAVSLWLRSLWTAPNVLFNLFLHKDNYCD